MLKIAKKMSQIFFGVESVEEMKKKGFVLSLAVPAVRAMDWVLMGVTATLVGFLRHYQVAEWEIFLVLWVGNMILSGAVVIANDKTSIDLTLMEGLRRLVDTAIKKSKITGFAVEAVILTRLLVWDGPDQFIIFFRNRLNSRTTKIATFIAASGFQMAIWTVLYIAGYDNFSELFRKLF